MKFDKLLTLHKESVRCLVKITGMHLFHFHILLFIVD